MIRSTRIVPYELTVRLRGRSIRRCGWRLELLDAGGRTGLGDAASWPGFGAAAAEVFADLQRSARALTGGPLEAATGTLAALDLASPAHYAAELAMLDLRGQREGVPLHALLGSSPSAGPIPVHVLVDDEAEARRAHAAGAVALKVKAGPLPGQALERVRGLARAAPGCRLRVDLNGAMDAAGARALLAGLRGLPIDWVEESVTDPSAAAGLRRFGIPLAADESVRRLPFEDLLADFDALVLKPMFVGGARRAVRLARRARRAGKRVCITHALESGVGRWGAVHVAAAVGGGPHGVGGDGAVGPLPVPTAAGLGAPGGLAP